MRTASEGSSCRQLKLIIKILEVVVLTSIAITVWSMFVVVPIMFYALPPVNPENKNDVKLTINSSAGECLERVNYIGTICSNELLQQQSCFSGLETNEILISSHVNQVKAEEKAKSLLEALPILSPSQECVTAIKPFMCLYLFGLCDANNQLRQVSQTDCVRIRDELCVEQWKAATMLPGVMLPDCSTFEDHDIQCTDINRTSFDQTSDIGILPSKQNVTCAEGFYLHNETTCRHLCSSWVDPPGIDADSVVVVASLVNALLSSVFVIVVVLTLLRNEMFSFPKYFLIYLCLSTTYIAFIIMIGVSDKRKLFCRSRDLNESYVTESTYCTLNGISYHYGVIQISLWTLFFTLGISWRIFFPFHYQRFKSAKRLKYIHIVALVLAITLPIIPILVQIIDGYHIPETSGRAICIGRNTAHTFYAFLLPFSIFSATITTLLVLIFWKILKELGIKKLSREKKPSSDVGKAEAKVLCITCYYILTSCIIIATFMNGLVMRAKNAEIIRNYLFCQSTGLQPGKECGEHPDMQLRVLNSMGTTSVFFQSFVPAVVLMFIVKYNCARFNRRSRGTSSSRTI